MIVDDEETVLKLFRMILTADLPECQIDLARNGAEAVDLFLKRSHNVLLMDLHMPVMDGQEAFMEIRRICEMRHQTMPSVVFCTGFAPPQALQAIVNQSEIHTLLAKPVTGDTLVRAIRDRLHPA